MVDWTRCARGVALNTAPPLSSPQGISSSFQSNPATCTFQQGPAVLLLLRHDSSAASCSAVLDPQSRVGRGAAAAIAIAVQRSQV